jgi:hypothetical protein
MIVVGQIEVVFNRLITYIIISHYVSIKRTKEYYKKLSLSIKVVKVEDLNDYRKLYFVVPLMPWKKEVYNMVIKVTSSLLLCC